MNAFIFIIPAAVITAVLFGRYRLGIRLLKTESSIDARVRLLSAGDAVGLDWRSDGTESSFRLLFFGMALRLSGKRDESHAEVNEMEDAQSDSPARHSRRMTMKRLRRLCREGWTALNRIVRVFRLESAAMKLRFGTGDPSTTGMLFGFTQTLAPVHAKKIEIDLVPDFVHRRLEGEADVTLGFNMARLLAVGITVFIRTAMAMRQT
jgi:hypothetical protein